MIKLMELTLDTVEVVLHVVFLTSVGDPMVSTATHETTLNRTLVILPSSVLGVCLSSFQKFFRVNNTHGTCGGWFLGWFGQGL